MESRTKFNLEENIELWRLDLLKHSVMTTDNIYELESHLLEEIEQLEKLGLNTEESLLIAKHRIGHISELSKEFRKVNNGVYLKNKITPYLQGILMFLAFVTLTNLLANLSLIIAKGIGMNNQNLNNISIAILFFASFCFVIILHRHYKNLNLGKLPSIPLLATVVIIGKALTFLVTNLMTSFGMVNLADYGSLQKNLSIYNLLFVSFIVTLSCILFYVSKKENKTEIFK